MTSKPMLTVLDPAERLSADDRASRTEEEFLQSALLAQQLRAAGGMAVTRGVCCNCDTRCAPAALYCDADCRADHETRLAVLAKQRR